MKEWLSSKYFVHCASDLPRKITDESFSPPTTTTGSAPEVTDVNDDEAALKTIEIFSTIDCFQLKKKRKNSVSTVVDKNSRSLAIHNLTNFFFLEACSSE